MKIAALETVRTQHHDNLVWLRLETDSGLVGTGETFFHPAAVETFIHESLAPLLIGADATRISALNAHLVRQPVGFGASGVEIRAASMIDMALWDVAGQAAGMPLHRLLGGLSRDRVRVYNTCAGPHYVTKPRSGDVDVYFGLDRKSEALDDLRAFLEEPERLARELLAEGVSAMKIWPFDRAAFANGGVGITTRQIDEGLAPFRRIRDAVGPAMDMMVELHSLWDLTSARRIAAAAADVAPMWIEDPIRMDDFESLALLARETRVPILASETLGPATVFQKLIASGSVGVVSFDVGWCGGVTQARIIAEMAALAQLPIAPHDCTGPIGLVAGCAFSLAAPNGFIQETVRAYMRGWYANVVTALPRVENGYLYPLDGPGLGTALKPDFLASPAVTRRVSGRSASA